MQKYLRDQRLLGTIEEVARTMFPFPGGGHPELETVLNVPEPRMSVGEVDGHPLYPHIVVVRRPGQWLSLMAEIEMPDSVSDDSALERWLPYSRLGDFILYVPAGLADEARKICQRHGVRVKGLRTWRFRPVWGLDVRRT